MRFNVQFTENGGGKMFTLFEGVYAMSSKWSFLHFNLNFTSCERKKIFEYFSAELSFTL